MTNPRLSAARLIFRKSEGGHVHGQAGEIEDRVPAALDGIDAFRGELGIAADHHRFLFGRICTRDHAAAAQQCSDEDGKDEADLRGVPPPYASGLTWTMMTWTSFEPS